MYAAAMRETSWPDALDALTLALGYEAATFYVHDRRALTFDPSRPVVRQGLWHRLDPSAEADYRDHYFRRDPRVGYTLAHPGTPLLYDHLFTSEREMRSSEYRDWYRRATGMEYTLGGHAGRLQPFFGAIALHRRRSAGPSTPAEHAEFADLFSHLERALGVEYRLYQGGQTSILSALTHDGPNGIVLLDRGGRVLHANAQAERLASACGLRLSGRIAASRRDTDERLGRAVAAAMDGVGGATVRIPRPDGGAHVVMLSPVTINDYGGLFDITAVAVCAVIVDANARPATSPKMLQAALDLTSAEARLLARLAQGDTITMVAKQTGLSPNTLRTHLASVFRKTGTSRQVELVQLVQTLVRAIPAM